MKELFRRGNGELISPSQMAQIIGDFIIQDICEMYEITIGTDSQNHDKTKMVEVISVRRIGDGGIFFYRTEFLKRRIESFVEKIYEEVGRSVSNAYTFKEKIQSNLLERGINTDTLNLKFQIHCDIGHHGSTKLLIKPITAWINAMGYECLIKPDSYAASSIANKFSK